MKNILYLTLAMIMVGCQANKQSIQNESKGTSQLKSQTDAQGSKDAMEEMFQKLQEQDDKLNIILFKTLEIPFENDLKSFLKDYKKMGSPIVLEKFYSNSASTQPIGQLIREECDGITVSYYENLRDTSKSRLYKVEVYSPKVKLGNSIFLGMSSADLVKVIGYEPSEIRDSIYIYSVGMNAPLGSLEFRFEDQKLKTVVFSYKFKE